MTHKELQAEIARLTDEELLDVLKNGQETMSPTGEVVRIRPSPQYMGQIIKRIKDLGIDAMLGTNSAADKLLARAQEKFKYDGKVIDVSKLPDDPEAKAI